MKWTGNSRIQSERGIALVVVILVTLVVAAVAGGAALVSSNTTLIGRHADRLGLLEAAADAGLEEARARINGDKTLYPDTGFAVLELNAQVTDARGNVIPNLRRSTYVGPTGITSGQYGVFGSIVVVVEDAFGNRLVRRGEVVQESFAKYAYFTDIEPSYIAFGGGDQIFGPVHTNDYLKIYPSGATFHGPVVTAKTVQGAQYGVFKQGYTENGPYIAMPQTADLNKLKSQAQAGKTSFTSSTAGDAGEATTRIEFVAIDLNGDGSVNGSNEGFIRVYQSSSAGWVSGSLPSDYSSNRLRNSENCGHYHSGGVFVNAKSHPNSGPDSWVAAVSSSTKRCYLGGSDSLWGGFQPSDGKGAWLQWPGPVSPLLSGRPDAQYLFPISRELNPSFKGVIYVEGKVAVSGVVRGRVTLAATDDIVIVDDLTYATAPGQSACKDGDILGLFSGGDIVVSDNTLNSPVRPTSAANYFTYDDTKDEFINAVVLALNIFTVENYASGATTAEPCESKLWGRGCLYLTGGIIQRTRGAVGTSSGTGYLKRYSYDSCAFSEPPPYFPTTGHFARGRYYEVDPRGFNVAEYFARLTGR
ncbi:MAG: hypothetical protein KatS3mg081_1942 [Gemmatimonadales bacterium]|nr:MAG: hypothetical protein KatS3mg081_1942 [Gemmatimonadales bacterium]